MTPSPRFNIKFNIKQLRAFVEVYRSGHLAAAADALALTPSAASVLINQLEAAAGGRLFERTARGFQPTALAHETAAHAERILHEVFQLEERFQSQAPRRQFGRLRFAATQSIASILMPAVISRFKAQHPEVQVMMHDCDSERIGALVAEGRVDFGLGSFITDTPQLSVDVILRDVISAIFPDTSELAGVEALTWARLADQPLIMSRHGGDGGVRRLVDSTLAAHGRSLVVAHEASSMNTALNMAAHGLGVAIYPPLLMPWLAIPRLVARRITEPEVERRLAVVRRKDAALPSACIRFIDVLKETLAAPPAPGAGGV